MPDRPVDPTQPFCQSFKPQRLAGAFSRRAIGSRWSDECMEQFVRFGKQWRSSPLLCSFEVFIRTALPSMLWVAEVHINAGGREKTS